MQEVPRFEIFECSLTADAGNANPFADVTLSATFTDGKRRYTVDGFYDGDRMYKIRFAPPEEGTWSYQTQSNLAALHHVEGTFECTPAVSRGALTIDPCYPHWFSREDGGAEFVVNDGWYPHPLVGDSLPFEGLDFPPPSETDMQDYLRILGDHGVNMTIEVDQLYARQSSILDESFNWPWAWVDRAARRIDPERFNLAYYRRMERTLSFAKAQGVFYGVELLFDNSVFRPREWSAHPLNRQNGGWLETDEQGTGWMAMFDLDNSTHVRHVERYLRYTVARLSAYWNVFWALGAESGNLAQVPGRELPVERIRAWYEHWGDRVADWDVYGRLQTIGDTGEQEALVRSRRNQFILTQEHTSMEKEGAFIEATHRFGERFWRYGRPTVIGEQDRHNVGRYEAERKGYWTAFVSGFLMGRVDRHFGVAQHGQLVESELFGCGNPPPIYADLKRMRRFVETEGVQYWRMAPADALLREVKGIVHCLAREDEAYVLYFVSGGSAELELVDCQYEWFNPRTAEKLEGNCKAGRCVFAAPDEQDWVLYIRRGDN